MIIYCIMFIYIFFVGILSKTYIQSRNIMTKYDNKTTPFFAVLLLVLPVFFIGMRTNYVDTWSYIDGFDKLSINWADIVVKLGNEKGRGWILYMWVIKRFITQNAHVFLMITAIIQSGAVLRLFYKYSNDYSYSMLIFFLSSAFVWMMNGIRQFMALSIILYFIDYLFEKKYINFMIIVLIAATIHVSAIIWIPAIFVVQGKPWNLRTFLFSGMILLAVLYVDSFSELLEETLVNTYYEGYTEQFSHDDGSNIMHTLIAFVPVALACVGKNQISVIDEHKLNILVNISVLGVMTNLLANFTSGILIGRMPIYFTIFNFILFPQLFDHIFNMRSKYMIRMLCILGYAAYAMYYMRYGWGSAGMPYISSVLGINTWS